MTHTPGCQQGTGPARNEGAPCALCAAAPDLLAALKALMPSAPCDGSCREGAGCAWTLARAAIARAEGA